ncbi:hypothetical protein KKB40_01095, partial [Patescibacteria group bacterium]|nr:hypothetical protein [Patescibacteria group bacterium]
HSASCPRCPFRIYRSIIYMSKIEAISPESKQFNRSIVTLSEFAHRYIVYLKQAEDETGFLSPGQGDRVTTMIEYCDFGDTESCKNRVIIVGSTMAILPPDPTEDEKQLALQLTQEGDQIIVSYQERFHLERVPFLSVPTVFVRTNEEMLKMSRHPGFAGVISLTSNPLGSTFNLQAAKYTVEKLGPELGPQAVRFSMHHENAHTVITRHQLQVCKERGIDDSRQAITFRRVAVRNSICWELAANEALIGMEVFPYKVANLAEPHPEIDIRKILEQRNIDLPEYDSLMYSPLFPRSEFEAPFVTSPACAHVYRELQKLTEKYRRQVNPDFYWTNYLAEYFRHFPLGDGELPLPEGFVELYEKH